MADERSGNEKLTFAASWGMKPTDVAEAVFASLTAAAWVDYRGMLRTVF